MGSINSKTLPNNLTRYLAGGSKKELGNLGLTYDERAAKLEAKEETELQRMIGNLFALHGVIANRSRMNKKKTDLPGWPDFTMSLNGVAVAIEVKIPGRTLDTKQVDVRAEMIAKPNSWRYFVAHSVAEVVEILREFGVIKGAK